MEFTSRAILKERARGEVPVEHRTCLVLRVQTILIDFRTTVHYLSRAPIELQNSIVSLTSLIAGESAIHDVCSKFNTSQFQAERGAFQEQVRQRLVLKYDQVSCDVTDLQVRPVSAFLKAEFAPPPSL